MVSALRDFRYTRKTGREITGAALPPLHRRGFAMMGYAVARELPMMTDAELMGALAGFADAHGLRLQTPDEMLAELRQKPALTDEESARLGWLETLVQAWEGKGNDTAHNTT